MSRGNLVVEIGTNITLSVPNLLLKFINNEFENKSKSTLEILEYIVELVYKYKHIFDQYKNDSSKQTVYGVSTPKAETNEKICGLVNGKNRLFLSRSELFRFGLFYKIITEIESKNNVDIIDDKRSFTCDCPNCNSELFIDENKVYKMEKL